MSSHSDRIWRSGPIAAVAVYLASAALLGFRSPGLHNDEAIFLGGAVQMLNSDQEPTFTHDPWSWSTGFGRRWPVMVLPYVGALRSYLAVVPFALFGPNYYSARLTTTAVGAFVIWGLAVLVREQLGAKVAAIASLILAINPSYLAQTIYDQGGVAEWMAAFAVISIALARYLGRPAAWNAFWLGVAVGFGVWSRANVAWLVGASALAALLVLGRRALPPLRHVAGLAAGGILGAAPLLWYLIRSGGATFAFMQSATDYPLPFVRLTGVRLRMLGRILLSDGEHRAMWNAPSLPLWQTILVSAVVLWAIWRCLFGPEAHRTDFGRAAALTFLFLLAFLLCSRLNVSDHHLIALVPIAATLVAAQSPLGWRGGALAAIYVCSAMYWNLTAAQQIRSTRGVDYWSNAIDPMQRYLEERHPGSPVKAVDWGIQHSLFVLSNARIRSVEPFWEKSWTDKITAGDVYVLHPAELAVFPNAAQDFLQALDRQPLKYRRTSFNQLSGAGYSEVVEILGR